MFANYEEIVRHFVSDYQVFLFMYQIKWTSAYWKQFQGEFLAMVKQCRCPTFLLTLSFADLRWNEFVKIISKLNSLGLSLEDIEHLNYFGRCNILNSNAVVLARLRAGPLGKVKYYPIRVGF